MNDRFVAEAKFQEKPEEYTKLIKENNRDEIMALLTNTAVEKRLLRRVEAKAALYGIPITSPSLLLSLFSLLYFISFSLLMFLAFFVTSFSSFHPSFVNNMN